jgi:hypothetical protein
VRFINYPFDRPYLDLYQRCLTTLRTTDACLRNPPVDKQVVRALQRLRRALAPVDCEVAFRQVSAQLQRRAALFDELRGVLRLATPEADETAHDLARMQKALDALVVSLKQRRPERGPAGDTRQAIDIIFPPDPATFNSADDWYDDGSDGPLDAVVSIAGPAIPVVGAWVVRAPLNSAPDLIGRRTLYDLPVDTSVARGRLPLRKTTSCARNVLP